MDALEWIMDVVKNDVEPQFDLNFAPDKPGLMIRRKLYGRAAAEAEAGASLAPVAAEKGRCRWLGCQPFVCISYF